GSKLLFESRARVTAYDNLGHIELYSYDQQAGRLSCVSCRPSGQPPTGDSVLSTPNGNRPVNSEFRKANDLQLPLSSDLHGNHIFFHSEDAILPGDQNGMYDVYEMNTISGKLSLISSGSSTADSAYYGNSLDGRDVFFFSQDNLAGRGENAGQFKLFDARV